MNSNEFYLILINNELVELFLSLQVKRMDRKKQLGKEGDTKATLVTKDNCKSGGYEYLDHPADVQIHSWGPDLKVAFEQAAVGMFGYMTDLTSVEIEEDEVKEIKAEGHDLESLLFQFLDEFLFVFASDYFVCKKIKITSWEIKEDADERLIQVTAQGMGEEFNLKKHPQGTEVKAITYSAMEVKEGEGVYEVYCIIDI